MRMGLTKLILEDGPNFRIGKFTELFLETMTNGTATEHLIQVYIIVNMVFLMRLTIWAQLQQAKRKYTTLKQLKLKPISLFLLPINISIKMNVFRVIIMVQLLQMIL